ncbi:MAG: bifunctional precorrin-2 dehydrogenase/sirohydrochlorin ferrochelatase [Chloroflexi bacterium]|nr:bifunctional precorrin-2 dehydrogenase/sirohydrochlorin ferrochelatase [Chloroflexota bacterium]
MADYYPAFLDLRGRQCLVVGGGPVAWRKAQALLQAGAQVRVIAPRLCPGLKRLAQAEQLKVEARPYQVGDLEGAWLAIAATDDRELNGAVASEAEARGLLINVVDDPARCNFIAPSVVRRGDLTLAISTGGRSPALALKLRQALEALLPQEYGPLLALLAQARQEARRQGKRISPRKWQESISPQVMSLMKDGSEAEARDVLLAGLGLRGGGRS